MQQRCLELLHVNIFKYYLSDGETAQIIANLALPPRESCSKKVSLESLYGMCRCFPDWVISARMLIKFLCKLTE